jgi:hypothetical protein
MGTMRPSCGVEAYFAPIGLNSVLKQVPIWLPTARNGRGACVPRRLQPTCNTRTH